MAGHSIWIKLFAAFALGVIACAGFYQVYFSLNTPAHPALTLYQMYQNAIEDTMVARNPEIVNNLTAIVKSNTALEWRGAPGNESVLVATFTRFVSSYPVGQTINTTWGDCWVTVVPELRTFFKTHSPSDNVTLRTEQLLGLPPGDRNTHIVEMWVSPSVLFRPAGDNEVTDTTAGLTFPANVSANYKAWFNNNIIASYYPEKFPWTRLGYTYDWGTTTGSHVGLSEFVIRQYSLAVVESVTPLADYLNS